MHVVIDKVLMSQLVKLSLDDQLGEMLVCEESLQAFCKITNFAPSESKSHDLQLNSESLILAP